MPRSALDQAASYLIGSPRWRQALELELQPALRESARSRSATADCREKVHFALAREGLEPGVLQDLPVDGDRHARAQLAPEPGEARLERADQLADGARLDLHG